MMYMGGKARIIRFFAPILIASLKDTKHRWVEPFVGGFNVVPYLAPWIRDAWCNDASPGLTDMFASFQKGEFDPPKGITEDEYDELRKTKGTDPKSVFISHTCTFGGQRWGTFARSRKAPMNFAARGRRKMHRVHKTMNKVRWFEGDYRALPMHKRKPSTVYCDPPYKGTHGYSTKIDYEQFCEWCESLTKYGHRVFVSEFDGYDRSGWNVVWSMQRKLRMNNASKKQPTRTEVLMEVVSQ